MWMGWWYPDCRDSGYTKGDPEFTLLEREVVVEVEVDMRKLSLGGEAIGS